MQANSYRPSTIDSILHKLKQQKTTQLHNTTRMATDNLQNDSQPNKKFVTFTYIGKETKFIMKLFKHANIQIAYNTTNTIGNLLRQKQQYNKLDIHNKSGVYQLTCPDCNMKYIGQTGRSFQKRYQEHMRDYKYKTGKLEVCSTPF
jgi:hypothetical protein